MLLWEACDIISIMEKSPAPIPIYTIGYGSRSIAELIEVLHQHEIAYLIDVRSDPVMFQLFGGFSKIQARRQTTHQSPNTYRVTPLQTRCRVPWHMAPYSRYKPEFSKAPLANELEQHGIRYVFMGDTLGGRPDDETCYVNGKIDYEKVKAMEFYQHGIQRLHSAFSQQQSIALMCSEGKPEDCHRCKLIGATLITQNIPVIHIDENDKHLTQEQIIERLTGGQLSMFGEGTFQSRKKYR